MNWIDFFILFVLFLALLNGYRRGIFKEISTFIGLIVGAVFAVSNADWLAMKLEGKINVSPSVLYVFSFIVVFIVCMVFLKILGIYFYKLVKINPIKFPNKVGGAIFGIFKGAIVLSLLFILFIFPTPFKKFDNAIGESSLARPLRNFVPFVYDNTTYFHPRSASFLGEIQKGILLSNVDLYAGDPQSALKDKVLLGMTDEDVATLDKLNRYFGEEKK